ncbi:MAG: 4-hydroxythreonine-4-phosphate dehydrogenase PdxA [Deltaproteobacteria bacterium]|nr:4-hydroxythreonine-4-phosphate dehydrogenase PdxA [Deltaproteobacteria bacterium]
MNNKPVIGVLLGDPTGIGPEVVVKLLERTELYSSSHIVIIGDKRIFEMGQKVVGKRFSFPVIQTLEPDTLKARQPVILDYPTIAPEDVTYKKVSARAGKSVYDTLEFTIKLALNKKIDGIVFAPLHKEAMGLGGCPYHAEIDLFKDRFNCPDVPGEINILEELWTTRITSHVPIREVSSHINSKRVYEAISYIDDQLKQYGIEAPRIAVSALNPHGGEGGRCGTEEIDFIIPAIQQARAEGIGVEGPFPADTIFLRVRKQSYQAVVSMYHDQGQIATKLLGFDKGVTLHGGMPVPITTPAHGTAYGRAGEGRANPQAMIRAFKIACQLAEKRKN